MSWQHIISTLQGILYQGRPEWPWGPHLQPYFCSALQALFARDASADWAPIAHQPPSNTLLSQTAQLQPVLSACVPERPACA